MEGYQRNINHFQQLSEKISAAQQACQSNVLCGEPMRMPELSREAERIEMLLGQLTQVANQLDVRLSPVTRGSIPQQTGNQIQREVNASPFACRLASMSDQLQMGIDLLMDLINRLEV